MSPARSAPLRIVAFGGGSGLSLLLRGLVMFGPRVQVTAVVAATDDGGSSGRLRRQLRLPAVGDARACLSAVAGSDDWSNLLEHRFSGSRDLGGHAVGNLLLAAAHEREGSFSRSLAAVSRLIGARCRVLPATNVRANVVTRMTDGRVIEGESVLAKVVGPVERVWLTPELVSPAPGVLDAIADAQLIVLGPGSLFTSVIASALPAGVPRAIEHSHALKVLVQNLTTQRGETDEMGLGDHVRAVQAHLGRRSIDVVLVHRWNGPPPSQGLQLDAHDLRGLCVRCIQASLAADHGRGRLHDSGRLARSVLRLTRIAGARTPRRSYG
jgi:uncharacterized cofD-like protein